MRVISQQMVAVHEGSAAVVITVMIGPVLRPFGKWLSTHNRPRFCQGRST